MGSERAALSRRHADALVLLLQPGRRRAGGRRAPVRGVTHCGGNTGKSQPPVSAGGLMHDTVVGRPPWLGYHPDSMVRSRHCFGVQLRDSFMRGIGARR